MIACLQADAGRLAAMGDAARARAMAQHNVDTEAGRLLQLFAGAVRTRPGFVQSEQVFESR
jgi:hypothetical protein